MAETNNKTILLVDDEAIIAMAEASTLEKHGYTVLTAGSGEEAIKIASGHPVPDLILMDIDLGKGMDGTQAAAIILEHLDIPVLFLSSHMEPEVVDKTEKITSYGYVVKNSGDTVLLASIRMAFRLHDANIEIKKHEDDLRRNENKLSLIFENTPNAITITDMKNAIIIDANRGIEWTGWTKEEIIGKSPQILQSWVNPDESERIRAIIKEKGILHNHRVDFYKKDGTIAHALMESATITIDGKAYILTVSNDITRLVNSENELHRAKEELEGANEELNATIEELEATNEEMQAANQELEESKNDLETLLAERKRSLKELGEKEYLLRKSQEIGRIGSYTLEFPRPGDQEYRWLSSPVMDDIAGIDADYPRTSEGWINLLVDPEKVLAYFRNEVIAKNQKFDLEFQIKRHSDGAVRWVWGLGEPVYDGRWNIAGMIGTAQDITDRKHADDLLRLSEERYRTIFEESATANIITSADTTILLANTKFTELTGYSREELEGKMSWTVFVIPEELEKMKQYHFQRRAEPGSPPQSYEFKGRIRSGEIRDFFMNVTMIPGSTESMAALIDITDRKRAEEASKKSGNAFKSLFESTPAGVALLKDRRFEMVNAQLCRITGYSREEMLGQSAQLNYETEDEYHRVGMELYGMMKEYGMGMVETRLKRKDDLMIDVYISASLLDRRDPSAGTVITVLDITDRKRAEESSRLSEERYRTIFEKSATANAILSEDTTILLVNTKFENVTGYPKEEMEGRMSWTSLVAPEDLEKMKTYHIERRIDPDSPPQFYEFRARIRSGEIRDFFLTIGMIPGTTESLASVLDITERKRAEKELTESEERYRVLFEKSATANAIIAEDTTILLANSNFEKLFGYSREEMEGQMSWTALVTDEYLEKMKGYHYQRRTGSDAPPQSYEFKGKMRSGEIRDIYMSVTMIPGTTESMISLIDITSLKQAEERFGSLARNLPETVFETDLQGTITFANEPSFNRFGYTREDLERGLSFLDFLVFDDHQRAIHNFGKVLRGKDIGLTEYTVRKKDGTTFPVLINTSLILRNGRPAGFRGFLVDITERKKTEQALRESEERWQFALEGAGDGVWDWNAQSDKVYFSRQWKAQLGYEDHEIDDDLSEWESRLHPDDRENTYRDLNRHLEGTTPVYVSEHRLRCKNGEYRWILDRGKIISRTPDGKPLRVIGTHTDITERKRNEERYSTFLGAALDGFIICDAAGHIIESNAAYCQMIGYQRDELLKMSVSDVEARLTSEEVSSEIGKMIISGSKRFETRHLRKDGSIIDVEVSVRVLEHENNRLFVFIRDITNQKMTAAALENSLHEKEALLRELQHRVKNSLAMIMSLISLEMEQPENASSRVILENLRGRIDSLASLYSLLFKSESTTRVNLDDYIDSVISSLAGTYIGSGPSIQLEKKFDRLSTDAKSATAWGLITNELLTNALKYAFPKGGKGTIRISLRRKKDVIELAVSDNGGGLPKGFDINKPKGFGTLLVKMLAEQLRGSFAFKRLKKENVFSVRAPAPHVD